MTAPLYAASCASGVSAADESAARVAARRASADRHPDGRGVHPDSELRFGVRIDETERPEADLSDELRAPAVVAEDAVRLVDGGRIPSMYRSMRPSRDSRSDTSSASSGFARSPRTRVDMRRARAFGCVTPLAAQPVRPLFAIGFLPVSCEFKTALERPPAIGRASKVIQVVSAGRQLHDRRSRTESRREFSGCAPTGVVGVQRDVHAAEATNASTVRFEMRVPRSATAGNRHWTRVSQSKTPSATIT